MYQIHGHGSFLFVEQKIMFYDPYLFSDPQPTRPDRKNRVYGTDTGVALALRR